VTISAADVDEDGRFGGEVGAEENGDGVHPPRKG
jgi:hypothetical protein